MVVTAGCSVLLGVGDTRMTNINLDVLVGIGVSVGETVYKGKEVIGITGAGTKIIPTAPIINRANPPAKLMTNSLGYAIRINEPN